jgi:hypothetical protein
MVMDVGIAAGDIPIMAGDILITVGDIPITAGGTPIIMIIPIGEDITEIITETAMVIITVIEIHSHLPMAEEIQELLRTDPPGILSRIKIRGPKGPQVWLTGTVIKPGREEPVFIQHLISSAILIHVQEPTRIHVLQMVTLVPEPVQTVRIRRNNNQPPGIQNPEANPLPAHPAHRHIPHPLSDSLNPARNT